MTTRHQILTGGPDLPELPSVGWCRLRHATDLDLVPKCPPHAWEFWWIRRGCVDWWVEGEVHEVRGGWFYLTRPGEEHGACSAHIEPGELFWAQLRIVKNTPLELTKLVLGLEELQRRTFPLLHDATAMWWRLLDEMQSKEDTVRRIGAIATMQLHLVEALRSGMVPDQSPVLSPAIARAIAFADANPDLPIPVGRLAQESGLGPSRFKECFAREVGDTPADWIRRRRIARAKRLLLTTDLAITAIATRLGFPTSQYFATAFTRLTGMTPTVFRSEAVRPRA